MDSQVPCPQPSMSDAQPGTTQEADPPIADGQEGRRSLLDEDWSDEYQRCTRFGETWWLVHQGASEGTAQWPRGYQLFKGKLLFGGRWCVPTGLTGRVMRAQHSVAGHVGGEQLWRAATRHYYFADADEAWRLAQHMIRMCEVCQACEHPHISLRLPIRPTRIPPSITTSVCIDIFQMPRAVWDGEEYDAFAACVDRHSGWVVATPHRLRGLTAAKVAKSMYESWWSPHGIPAVITSDRGPQFAGAWWRTMCAALGIRQAYAQAYHHSANGRAEVVGAQLQKRLRKLQAEEGICWVPSLQRAVRMLHDVPGPSGLSPYQILYGRDRPYAGVPYEPPRAWPDAVAFFEQQKAVDSQVAHALNDLHERQAKLVNKRRRELRALVPGQKIWWIRPKGRTGDKLDTEWVGPCTIVQRVGEHSYVVRTREGHQIDVHRCHLKEHVEDEYSGRPLALFHFKQAAPELDMALDEWTVDKILAHRVNKAGDLEFQVRWLGSEQLTWEPIGNFFLQYTPYFIKYCRDKGLHVDVVDYLARHPADAALVRAHPVAVRVADALLAPKEENALEWEEPPEDWPVETPASALSPPSPPPLNPATQPKTRGRVAGHSAPSEGIRRRSSSPPTPTTRTL